MSKRTNLDIKDAAFLNIVHNLQHPTFHPTTESTQTTRVNGSNMNFSPLPAAKYGKSTKRLTQRRQSVNQNKSGLEAETVRALGPLHSGRSKKKLAVEKQWESHILSIKDKDKSIEDYAGRETTGARKQVEDAEAAISQEQENTEAAENAGLTTTEPEKTFPAMIVASGDYLSDIASSDDGEDGEDQDDEETEEGQLREDDEPGWVMGTITNSVP